MPLSNHNVRILSLQSVIRSEPKRPQHLNAPSWHCIQSSIHTAYDNLTVYTLYKVLQKIYTIFTLEKALSVCKPPPCRHLKFCRKANFVPKVLL